MKLFITLSSICIAAMTSGGVLGQEADQVNSPKTDSINWLHDLDEAIIAAKEAGKPLMTYFTFNTCHWCHKLEEDTFSDSSVIQRSRDFVWVKINRDVTPEPCSRFNISAYPTLMVLSDDQEKIYRFSGYKLPDAFLPELDEADRRYELYRAGKAWDIPTPRAERMIDDESFPMTTLSAASDSVPAGFAFVGDRAFVAFFMNKLYEVDPGSGEIRNTLPLPQSVIDICTDGEMIYGVTSGWTAGQPIYVIDPDSGQIARKIITEANTANGAHGAKGIEFIDGKLVILEGMRGTLRMVDPATGEVTKTIQSRETWISGLAFDGEHFVSVAKDRIVAIDPASGATARSTSVNYPLRSVGVRSAGEDSAARELWVMEQPIWGYDINHQRVQIWPRSNETMIYRLTADAP